MVSVSQEKLNHRTELDCIFVQRLYTRISRQSANDVVQCGLLDVAHGSEFVDGDSSFVAELTDAMHIKICVNHGYLPLYW